MSWNARDVLPDVAGLLWDTHVAASDLLSQFNSHHSGLRNLSHLKSFCCTWNHVLSFWLPPTVMKLHSTAAEALVCLALTGVGFEGISHRQTYIMLHSVG